LNRATGAIERGFAALNGRRPLNRDVVALNLERGFAALPAAQQPYTAEGPYTPQSGHARGSAALELRRRRLEFPSKRRK